VDLFASGLEQVGGSCELGNKPKFLKKTLLRAISSILFCLKFMMENGAMS
jgi:hypothetical protein